MDVCQEKTYSVINMNNEGDAVDDNAFELEILEVRNDEGTVKQDTNDNDKEIKVKRRRTKTTPEEQNRIFTILWKLLACRGSRHSKNSDNRREKTKRGCCGCGSRKRRSFETERRIRANDRAFNSQFNYANNYIKTSKYSVTTFLPLNLFEQFQRLANFYFLCLMILQMINIISSLTPVTTAVPLIGVLCLTAIKDAYDDYQRHKSDSQVNNRKSMTVQNGYLVEERWSQVHVGDIIRMENNQFVAADVLLLSTSEPNGLCFIETAELDGETNLKCRQCLPETTAMGQDDSQIGAFDGEIICETPNNLLNKFEGFLTWKGRRFPLDNDLVVLRGCVLRNTEWCYGVVIFAGKDTKLMQNSGKTKFKRTSIDHLLNFIIIGIVCFLLAICLFCMFACDIWEMLVGYNFQIYLPWDSIIPKEPPWLGAGVISLLVFFSYAIVLNTVVPISLYVSVEVIRFVQSFLINWDENMYCDRRKMSAKARTTTLNEELGQIQYIFSDKTGTLTRNIMAFNKCSIAGVCYGEIFDQKTGELIEVNETTEKLDFSFNPNHESDFRFYDKSLLDVVRNGQDKDVQTFFRLLALCHTVMSEKRNGRLEYQAQSPDEAALVSAARNFGFVFKERTPNSITIEVMGKVEEYELLCILDFNNARKRMSVILRRDHKLRLYCKGADSVVYERLRPGDATLRLQTQEHLNKFAGEGLRTLCCAIRDLDESFFNKWKERHHEATLSLGNREDKLDAIYEEIETDMTLIGATAIEDKLQDGVQHTIANLSMAEIKIWVLTGDKQDSRSKRLLIEATENPLLSIINGIGSKEPSPCTSFDDDNPTYCPETAVNIGYACNLLNDDMDILVVDGNTLEEVSHQLSHCNDCVKPNFNLHRQHFAPNANNIPSVSIVTFSESDYKEDNSPLEYALVVSGHSLVHALHPQLEKLFVEVSTMCKSVICCRVTPLQKAMVVEVIKKNKKVVTLAIGDGANDVSMIKAAHIGVGISGEEGNQAMLSSDYSIAQFRFLERLLLVHGRWSYYRMCKFLRYFFYKNFAFTICHFWFAFFCGFSAQTVLDPMFIAVYNLFYTSLPVLAVGVFDQDVSDTSSIQYPHLYSPGHKNLLFNKQEFLRSALHGFFTSCVLFLVPYGTYRDGVSPKGIILSDTMFLGSAVATILVVLVTVQIALDTAYWTVFNHITIWGSLASYFILDYAYNYIFVGSYYGALTKALNEPSFWFMLLLTIVVLIIPVLAWRFYFIDVFPTLSDRVRLKQRLQSLRSRHSQDVMRTPSARRTRRSIRSGYAFAHQEGFGRLITSGKIMRKVPPRSDTDFLGFHPTPQQKKPELSPIHAPGSDIQL